MTEIDWPATIAFAATALIYLITGGYLSAAYEDGEGEDWLSVLFFFAWPLVFAFGIPLFIGEWIYKTEKARKLKAEPKGETDAG